MLCLRWTFIHVQTFNDSILFVHLVQPHRLAQWYKPVLQIYTDSFSMEVLLYNTSTVKLKIFYVYYRKPNSQQQLYMPGLMTLFEQRKLKNPSADLD